MDIPSTVSTNCCRGPGNRRFMSRPDRCASSGRIRTLRLPERRAYAHGRWTSRQPSRRIAAVGLETGDSCQDLTDVQAPDAYEKRRRELTLHARLGRRDKKGSPVEPQAIDMAWVLACRSVGVRAAPCVFNNAIKTIFGTVGAFARLGRLP